MAASQSSKTGTNRKSEHSQTSDARKTALQFLQQLFGEGQGISLRDIANQLGQSDLSAADKGLTQDICYGVCRHYRLLNHWLDSQMKKPLKASALSLRLLLCCGLYEVWFSQRPDYAIVSQWPTLAKRLKFDWARGLVNALLRQAGRIDLNAYRQTLPIEIRYSLSDTLLEQWRTDWPQQLADIAAASNLHPPMCLRNNILKQSRQELIDQLEKGGITAHAGKVSAHSIYLESSLPVSRLPGFEQGLLSVQDEAAQLPATLFDLPTTGVMRLLDACSAPGGKTGQLLENHPNAAVHALDIDQQRLDRVGQNLARLELKADLFVGNASHPADWWDGMLYDAILLDAPCSATGIVRRQPDIKWHRTKDDFATLVETQKRLLDALWELLKPGGILIYATCSINPQENALQIQHFLRQHSDAIEQTPFFAQSVITGPGCQLLPTAGQWDGFYFSKLIKAKRAA